ncbi:Calcineurin-like phosphoesterase [Corynebacterium glaucum]|uniref:Calcineurin-like phosphoesterase n=1 Tax=Corynebacterium glaucum TaxID=187491 RepID=A0A1Q2HXQ3_9CORY|nr:metallophosphoesterase [Corynebacterium glaucum]AQQ15622.1 Calcineurin-like phosphoesterase [Corynebacterium glaucum]
MDPILALADIHLGRKQSGDKKIGPGLAWALDALDQGAKAGARHLIMAGDIIDRKRFTEVTYDEVNQFFERGLSLFDTVLFTPGNHDTHHNLDLPTGVTVASPSPATYLMGSCAVHTAGVEVDKDPRELVGSFPLLIDGTVNLGILHTSLTGEHSNNPCLPCTREELLDYGCDAWLLGHVHQPVSVNESPFIGWIGMGRALIVRTAEPQAESKVTVEELTTVRWKHA